MKYLLLWILIWRKSSQEKGGDEQCLLFLFVCTVNKRQSRQVWLDLHFQIWCFDPVWRLSTRLSNDTNLQLPLFFNASPLATYILIAYSFHSSQVAGNFMFGLAAFCIESTQNSSQTRIYRYRSCVLIPDSVALFFYFIFFLESAWLLC